MGCFGIRATVGPIFLGWVETKSHQLCSNKTIQGVPTGDGKTHGCVSLEMGHWGSIGPPCPAPGLHDSPSRSEHPRPPPAHVHDPLLGKDPLPVS